MSHLESVPSPLQPSPGIEILAQLTAAQAQIATPAALGFVAQLERALRTEREQRLAERAALSARWDIGWRPDFLEQTRALRESEWRVAEAPADLVDRRVEITGPVDRKMIINALNSGAQVFMADFEDSCSPTWENCIDGQILLRDAVRRTIDFEHPQTGKRYVLKEEPATLVVRPRGWHLDEPRLLVDGRPASASLFDFGLFFFHNAAELIARGSGPYFYLPKLENHLEARLWNRAFELAQDELGIPRGTIRATVLIETLPAAFEMDEILYELRQHICGLNCGRWDYIFSFIKKHRADPNALLPDRASVGMDRHFLRSYSQLLIRTCHRRGAHAMGGMAAQIPIKGDEQAGAEALAKVRADKAREARDGHDGTWVAHPGLVALACEEFERVLGDAPNQLERMREDVQVEAQDLLRVPQGAITEGGIRHNVSVGLRYLAAWLSGNGCVPIFHLMEDAATAEISRTQLWQWRRHAARLEDGRLVDKALLLEIFEQELGAIRAELGEVRLQADRYPLAAKLFEALVFDDELADFLTTSAIEHLR